MTSRQLPNVPGKIVLLAVVGSTAYGLAHEGSDIDRSGIYLSPTRPILGLKASKIVEGSVTQNEPDVAFHELGKFSRLALAVNPTVTELLWAASYETLTPEGQRLVDIRSAFLSTEAVRSSYIGYGVSQAKRLLHRQAAGSPDPRTAKHARHCARLMLQAEELLTTGKLTLDVSSRRNELFEVSDMALNRPADFEQWFEGAKDHLTELPSVLPDNCDTALVESVVQEIRLASLDEERAAAFKP